MGTSYGQYCPIAKATELLGERWTVLVVRELLIGSHHFNDVARGLPTMSRTLLAKRLRELVRAGIVEQRPDGYHLTPAGEALRPIVFGVGEWAATWILTDPRPDELDPVLLLWWAHGTFDRTPLPERRVVVSIALRDDPRRFWLVFETDSNSLCYNDPGFDVDATVTTDLLTLHRVFHGREPLASARRAERLTITGRREITRHIPAVLTVPSMAERAAAVG
jgi:DNA-binding HxlR family transcriptional regulator